MNARRCLRIAAVLLPFLVEVAPPARAETETAAAWTRYLEGRLRVSPDDDVLAAALLRAYRAEGRYADAAHLARRRAGGLSRALAEQMRSDLSRALEETPREAVKLAALMEAWGVGVPGEYEARLLRLRLAEGDTASGLALLDRNPHDSEVFSAVADRLRATGAPPDDWRRLFEHYRGPFPDDAVRWMLFAYAVGAASRDDVATALLEAGRPRSALLFLDAEEAPRRYLRVALASGDLAAAARAARRIPLEEAYRYYRDALEREGASSALAAEAGRLALALGREEEALRLLSSAAEEGAEPPELPFLMARRAERRGETTQALALYDRALRANPTDTRAARQAALLAAAAGDYEGAIRRLASVPDVEGDLALDRIRFRYSIEVGDLDAAEVYAARLAGSDDRPLRELRGRRAFAEDRVDEAIRLLEPLLSAGELAPLYRRAAEIAVARGDLNAAKEAARRWRAARPDDPAAAVMLDALSADVEGGKRAWKRAALVEPLWTEEHLARLKEALREGRLDVAAELAARYRASRPADAEAWALIGLALYEAGREEDAFAAWRRSLEIDPDQPDLRELLASREGR